MASASPPPPPDPNRLRTSPCCGSSSSSPPRNALRRSKTVANPESPLRWRREPLVDVTNLVLGRAGREMTGRLQVSSLSPLHTPRNTTPRLPALCDASTFFGCARDPTRAVHQSRRSCLDRCILRECRCTEGCTVELHGSERRSALLRACTPRRGSLQSWRKTTQMAAPSSSFRRRSGQHTQDSGPGAYAYTTINPSVQEVL